MKKNIEYYSSDKMNWLKNHSLSEEQRKKLIEDKLNRAVKILTSKRVKSK